VTNPKNLPAIFLYHIKGQSLILVKCDFFVQLCSSWRDFNCLKASRGPSAIAELLVWFFVALSDWVIIWGGTGRKLQTSSYTHTAVYDCGFRRRLWSYESSLIDILCETVARRITVVIWSIGDMIRRRQQAVLCSRYRRQCRCRCEHDDGFLSTLRCNERDWQFRRSVLH